MFSPEAFSPDYDWHELVFDDAKRMAAIIGIDVDDIRYSGFWSQGDGASFTGSYAYVKGAAIAIRAEAPIDAVLHGIADRLQAAQRKAFYRLAATVTQSGRYSHEMTMSVDVEDSSDSCRDIGDAEAEITECLRDFARWIYRALEAEYEYQSAWQLAVGWQDAGERAESEKAAARQLIRDMRANRRGNVPISICSALRDAVRRHLDDMANAIKERADIAAYFHFYRDGRSVPIEAFVADNI